MSDTKHHKRRRKAKFSIITVTYNAGETLTRTLNSVMRQEYEDIEHIIVDGASTDNTLEIAKDYRMLSDAAHNGHFIHISSEHDEGIYDAMNKGIHLASGDYLLFLNAGDALPDSHTIEQVAKGGQLAEKKAEKWPGVIYGDTDIIDNEGKVLGRRRLRPPKRLTWKSFRMGMVVCHQAFYARLDIARYIYFNLDYRYSADVDWCIRVMKEAERCGLPITNANATVAHYLKEGETTRHHRQSLKERYDIMCAHYGTIVTTLMHGWFAIRNLMAKDN